MRGSIDGLRVSLADKTNGIEIEVDYKSGLQNFDIRPVTSSVFGNVERVHTGDQNFDAVLQVHSYDVAAVTNFLTPLRREALLALHSAVQVDDIDEDELEVRLPHGCTTSEIVDAVKLAVQVAKILDTTQPAAAPPAAPQDVVTGYQHSQPQDSYPQDAVR